MGSIVLAGGRSTRMGADKCSLVFDGEVLLHRVISRLNQLDGQIILVLAEGQPNPYHLPKPKVDLARDLFAGKGPLVGIYSGLKASHEKYCITVACDMPFLNIDLIRYMMGLTDGYDVVIPRIDGLLEPLHAVYSVDCLEEIDKIVKEDHLSIQRLFKVVRVRYVEENEIDIYDKEHLSWFNTNTPSDMEKAIQLVKREAPINDLR